MFRKLRLFLANLEWQWSLFDKALALFIATSSIAIPAWAVSVMNKFSEYSPLSWVLAGFTGLSIAVLLMAIYAWSKRQLVKAKYDDLLLGSSNIIDPMAKVFERKRIYFNNLILPSAQILEDKSFIDCEIVGPCNIYLIEGNSIKDIKGQNTDGVILEPNKIINNAHGLRNCSFKGYSFHKITLLFSENETDLVKDIPWINWISKIPNKIIEPIKNPEN